MGHMLKTGPEYRLLREKLDRNPSGAPDSPALMTILSLLYSPDQARLAGKIPGSPTPLPELSRRTGIPEGELGGRLTEMARRGTVVDLEHDGVRYFMLPPVVIGFFEFTFMRARPELPMKELAALFDEYMRGDDRFARSVFRGETQIGRALVREEALPEDDHSEILDWERTSKVVEGAKAVGVSLCSCRHKAGHLDKACGRPERTCLTLNYAAENMIRNGMAERISKTEALDIVAECKGRGMAQIGDNVQKAMTYICNCCGCCCGMLNAIKTFDIRNAVVSSNWLMDVDVAKCSGCGKCIKACPIGAIRLETAKENGKNKGWAVRDETLCLGCGVCPSSCETGAASMRPRERRVFTPETVFDKVVAMSIERGKLAELLFESPEKLTHRMFARVVKAVESSAPYKAAMAVRPLKSAFLNAVVAGAKAKTGALASVFE